MTKDEVSGRTVEVELGCRAHPQQDPWELVGPGVSLKTHSQGSFEGPVEMLDQAVRLRMVSACEVTIRAQERSDRGPQGTGKLRTPVRGDMTRDTMTGHPSFHEGSRTGFRCGRGQRNGLWPPGGSVNTSQDVSMTTKGRKGAHQIYEDMREWL